MVALTLTPEQLRVSADAARADAQGLRMASRARRIESRQVVSRSAASRRSVSSALAWLAHTRELRYRSAWSELPWQLPDRELDTVLVPHDGSS